MLVVKPVNQTYGVKFKTDEGEVIAHVRQLNYKTRNLISGLITSLEGGKMKIDHGLNCFLNIKYALRKLEGVKDEEGNDYALEFDPVEDCLTDSCVDALLSTELTDKLLFTSRYMGANVPTDILDPTTNEPLEGVSVIKPKDLGGIEKN